MTIKLKIKRNQKTKNKPAEQIVLQICQQPVYRKLVKNVHKDIKLIHVFLKKMVKYIQLANCLHITI